MVYFSGTNKTKGVCGVQVGLSLGCFLALSIIIYNLLRAGRCARFSSCTNSFFMYFKLFVLCWGKANYSVVIDSGEQRVDSAIHVYIHSTPAPIQAAT